MFNLIEKVLADDGSFFLNVGRTSQKPWLAQRVVELLRFRFKLQNEIIWAKSVTVNDRSYGQFRPVPGKRFLTPTHEHVYHLTKRGDVEIDRLALGVPYSHRTGLYRFKNFEDTRCGGTIWTIPHDSTKSREDKWSHPCPFPVELPVRCIKLHGIKEGMTVLDPFNGVGGSTTAMAQLGVNGIGIDLDEGYCQTAKSRLLEEQDRIAQFRKTTTDSEDADMEELLYLRQELMVILEDCIDLGGQSSQQNIKELYEMMESSKQFGFNVVLASISPELHEFYRGLPASLAA
ncbi:Modification methylase DpnIIB [Rosistilla carotiformis]|uniref:Methyltransferase n=1 Tax=Rosistilla carotiformis TaxID=2528017 RepID=A0A518JTY7_9BACT|nr:DNA methyltransferase [Rosistilla carotiformis]QDV69010.1 Modification methylase DpnIIB [Rosistilla carotiformis]